MPQYLERSMPDGSFIRAEYGLEHIVGNSAPHFHVTGSIWEERSGMRGSTRAKRNPDNPDISGMVHEEALAAFPELADLIALHLSDMDGTPMHALANSRYFFEQGQSDIAARTLRVTVPALPTSAEDFPAFVEEQRPRWAAEAAAAIEAHDLTVDHTA
jgi:hypothetical protein